jgi:hypothetical protein
MLTVGHALCRLEVRVGRDSISGAAEVHSPMRMVDRRNLARWRWPPLVFGKGDTDWTSVVE